MNSLSHRSRHVESSPTLAITVRANQMKAEGKDVIGFGAGEPDFDTPDFIKEAAIKAIREGKTKYTAAGGITELKDAIIQKFKRDNGLDYSRDEILVSAGGKHALYNACQALLNPGDEVIIPAPYWVSTPAQVILNDAKPVFIPTSEKNGFRLTADQLEAALTPKTKVLILNTPSNPTGMAYSREELEPLAELIVRHQLICFSDEIYEKIVFDGFKHWSIAALGPEIKKRTLTFNGASKVYSMTGWRLGYVGGPREIIQTMTDIQSQATSSINTPTQWAVVTALNSPQDFLKKWVAEFQVRRDYILKKLSGIPRMSCLKPQGAFFVFPNISAFLGKSAKGQVIRNSDDMTRYLLEEALVAVVPGSCFGSDAHLRLSYATSIPLIEKGLDRVATALKALR